jgi:AcrR family transcriptional regulator
MIAKQAGISKRTFYHRFNDKADIFRAVVHRLIGQLRPGNTEGLFEGASAEEILRRIAPIILQASLSPQSLALNRIILAESARFPELALVVNEQGMRKEAIQRIAAILDKEVQAKRFHIADTIFAAEQFLVMTVAGPQRRAYGLGNPMTKPELAKWADNAVDLFLKGCRG